MYGKIVKNGKTVRVFPVIDNSIPYHVQRILDLRGTKFVPATPDEFMKDYAMRNKVLPETYN